MKMELLDGKKLFSSIDNARKANVYDRIVTTLKTNLQSNKFAFEFVDENDDIVNVHVSDENTKKEVLALIKSYLLKEELYELMDDLLSLEKIFNEVNT